MCTSSRVGAGHRILVDRTDPDSVEGRKHVGLLFADRHELEEEIAVVSVSKSLASIWKAKRISYLNLPSLAPMLSSTFGLWMFSG
jgi:hypothetical protein